MVGFVRVPLMLAAPVPAAPPVNPPVTTGLPQVYVVPAGTIPFVIFTGVDVKPLPEQLMLVMALITGVGLIVTLRLKLLPTQPAGLVGVML